MIKQRYSFAKSNYSIEWAFHHYQYHMSTHTILNKKANWQTKKETYLIYSASHCFLFFTPPPSFVFPPLVSPLFNSLSVSQLLLPFSFSAFFASFSKSALFGAFLLSSFFAALAIPAPFPPALNLPVAFLSAAALLDPHKIKHFSLSLKALRKEEIKNN